jgi:hypothetical protein
MPCPNKNHPDWIRLSTDLGEANALLAFTLNDYEIPTLDQARALLEQAQNNQAQNGVSSPKIKQLKLQRVDEQISVLEQAMEKPLSEAQKQVLQTLKDNLEAYRRVIEEDGSTVSVSNLFAGGEIEDTEKYKNYAEFGSFLHFAVETLQKESLDSGQSLTRVFTEKKLKDLLSGYEKKFKITELIENGDILNQEDLFNMTRELLGVLDSYTSMGYTILPEMTIMSVDRMGRNIVGRLDMMAVDKKGRVSVMDLKTKKLKAAAKSDALSRSYPVNPSSQADSKFSTGYRNTYENWDIQLALYARMLQQAGIDVTEKRIIGLMYFGDYTNPEGKQFTDAGEDTFVYRFYKVMGYLSSEHTKDSEIELLRYKNNLKKVGEVIPLKEEDVPMRDPRRDEHAFDLPQEQAEELVSQIKDITQAEMTSAKMKLKDAKSKGIESIELVKYYEDRIGTLNKVQEALKRDTWEAPYKVGFVVRTLDVDLRNLVNTLAQIKTISSEKDLMLRAKDLERLNKTAIGYEMVTKQITDLLIEAQVPNDSSAMQTISNINNNIGRVRKEYNRLGFQFMVHILKNSMTDIQVERLNDQRRQSITDLLARLKKQKEAIEKQGGSRSLWQKISQPITTLELATARSGNTNTALETLELKIEKLELELQGVKMDEASIKKYVQAILNPKSPIYIGERTGFFTQYIAGSSSADWVLSSYANQLKMTLATGGQEFINFIEKEKVQQELDQYKGGQTSMAALNDPISEVRTALEFDQDGNEREVKTRAFVNPIVEEYYHTFDRYWNQVKRLEAQIKEAAPDKKRALKDQLQQIKKDHLQWRMENTQMKYRDEFYEIDKMLPEEYKHQRDELYQEKSELENSAGFNNQEYLDESAVRRIAEIEVELKKLRKKYADMKEGGYARYLELSEKYYDYEVNWNYFNRLYDQKKIELTDQNGNVDVEALARWKAQNMVRRPREEWYDLVGEKWDEIFSIIGAENPAIQELKDQYREILSQYKRQGIVDSRFMTQQDIDILDEIEKIITAYKGSGGGLGLDFMERQRLNDLFGELETLQTRVENPFYVQEFNERLDDLDIAWNNYQDEKDQAQKEQYMEQYLLKEMDFKTWYDNNHLNEFTSRFVSNDALNPLPKKFNTITVPLDEAMMEEVPDFKFTKRVIKPTAINLNYQKDAMGYPMPKGLIRADEEPSLVEGNSKWLNPKYLQIRSSPKTASFYHSFVDRFLKMQDETTGRKLGYNFPGYEQQSVDAFKEKGIISGIKSRAGMFKEKNLTVAGSYDYSINGFATKEDDRIVFRHNTPLPLEQQTTDGIGAVIRWYQEAFINKHMAQNQALNKSVISYLEELYEDVSQSNLPDRDERMEGMRRVIDTMKFEYDKFVKGEWKKDEGLAGRFGDLMLKGIGFTRMALDIPNQMGNLFSGNVQAFLGSSKTRMYSGKNYLWAKSMVESRDGVVGSLMRDYGKISGKSFMTKMLLYWNPMQNSLDHYYNRTRSTGQRIAQGAADLNFMFYIQDKGELEIASTIWLSMMDNVKIKVVKSRDENGKVLEYEKDESGNIKTVNLYEAYTESENGEIIIRPDVEWSRQQEQGMMKSVWSEVRRTQGKYAEWDKSKAEAGITGRMLLFYRKYLEPALRNRFGRREDNWEAGEVAMGFYNAMFQALRIYSFKDFFAAMFGSKTTKVTAFYQGRMQQAGRELLVAGMLYMLRGMLLSMMPGDDEDDIQATLLKQLMVIYAKVDMETRSLVPLPMFGGVEDYLRNFSSFTNAGRDVSRIFSMIEHAGALGMTMFFDSDSEIGEFMNKQAYYQRRTKLFEEGEAKVKKDIMDLVGYMNIYELFNPDQRIANMKTRQ